MSGRSGASRSCWPAALVSLTLLVTCSRCDVIFRVPEVVVRHAAASKAVGTGHVNGSRGNGSEQWSAGTGTGSSGSGTALLEVHYEEYFVEHDVSTADARRAAQELDLDKIPVSVSGCGACSRREVEYCETRLLADHCCCERRFLPEPFPWLPHTCYVGPARCHPLAHDCANYARLRDCCCYRRLAERWKGILSKSSRLGVSGVSLLLLSMLLFVAYL